MIGNVCPVCGRTDTETFTAADGELGTRAVSHIGCVRGLYEARLPCSDAELDAARELAVHWRALAQSEREARQ